MPHTNQPHVKLKTREDYKAEFIARTAKGAARAVPGHIISRCDRLIVDSRVPLVHEVTPWVLAAFSTTLSRALDDAEHILAIVCCLRGEKWQDGAGRDLRKLCERVEQALALIRDQTHAAEDETEAMREAEPL